VTDYQAQRARNAACARNASLGLDLRVVPDLGQVVDLDIGVKIPQAEAASRSRNLRFARRAAAARARELLWIQTKVANDARGRVGCRGLIAGFSYTIFRSGRAAPYVKRLMRSPLNHPSRSH
jgi:hypothetical protein